MVLAVIALGGNAILRAGEEATLTNQMRHLQLTCRHIMNVLDGFDDLVITHGNGPQVGDIVMQNELSREDIPPMPLDVCVAESQGQMGYMIQLSLLNALERSGKDADVFCTLGTVLIDNRHLHDLSTKPIGPFYSASEVEVLRAERDWEFVEDLKRGGYRRVVPSPPPIQVLGMEVLQRLIGQVEAQLQKQGKSEVSSRVVGDLVIDGLKEMDQIAYIRYAIVYLGLDDLHSLRNEIDHLLES